MCDNCVRNRVEEMKGWDVYYVYDYRNVFEKMSDEQRDSIFKSKNEDWIRSFLREFCQEGKDFSYFAGLGIEDSIRRTWGKLLPPDIREYKGFPFFVLTEIWPDKEDTILGVFSSRQRADKAYARACDKAYLDGVQEDISAFLRIEEVKLDVAGE